MSDKKDTDQIITEFLDIWQKQFSYLSKDPETVAQMLKMYQQTQENFFGSFRGGNNAQPDAAPDLFVDANAYISKLNERIAGLEARVSELESRIERASEETSGTDSGNKSGRAGRGSKKPTNK